MTPTQFRVYKRKVGLLIKELLGEASGSTHSNSRLFESEFGAHASSWATNSYSPALLASTNSPAPSASTYSPHQYFMQDTPLHVHVPTTTYQLNTYDHDLDSNSYELIIRVFKYIHIY